MSKILCPGKRRGTCLAGVAVLLLLAMLSLAACGGTADTTTTGGADTSTQTDSSTGSGEAGEVEVVIRDYTYVPDEVVIKVGESVTWINEDSVRHNAAADDNAFEGPLLSQGESYTYTFDVAGEYPYHCTPHPYMKAVVIVE